MLGRGAAPQFSALDCSRLPSVGPGRRWKTSSLGWRCLAAFYSRLLGPWSRARRRRRWAPLGARLARLAGARRGGGDDRPRGRSARPARPGPAPAPPLQVRSGPTRAAGPVPRPRRRSRAGAAGSAAVPRKAAEPTHVRPRRVERGREGVGARCRGLFYGGSGTAALRWGGAGRPARYPGPGAVAGERNPRRCVPPAGGDRSPRGQHPVLRCRPLERASNGIFCPSLLAWRLPVYRPRPSCCPHGTVRRPVVRARSGCLLGLSL